MSQASYNSCFKPRNLDPKVVPVLCPAHFVERLDQLVHYNQKRKPRWNGMFPAVLFLLFTWTEIYPVIRLIKRSLGQRDFAINF